MRRVVTIWFLVTVAASHASVVRYRSGLGKDWSFTSPAPRDNRLDEQSAVLNFLREEFGQDDFVAREDAYRWLPVVKARDNVHTHRIFELTYQGRKVFGHVLKTHFNRKGFLEYASSSWEHRLPPFRYSPPRFGEREVLEAVRSRFIAQYRGFDGEIELSPTIWVDDTTGEVFEAFEVFVSWWRKMMFRHQIVSLDTREVLKEYTASRHSRGRVTVNSRKVYKVSPLGMGTSFDTADITDLNASTSLRNSYLYVRREENTLSPQLKDIDASIDYTDSAATGAPAFTFAPGTYGGATCSGSGSLCPNQSFDAVNVYYHVNSYRQTVESYFSALGVSSSVSAYFQENDGSSTDPLNIIVNSLGVDFDNDGDGTDEANNAAYVPQTCRAGLTPTFSRCLVFLRPVAASTESCTGSVATITFFDLAREGIVVVHEYQHYVTDRITRMVPGTYTQPNVGDSLHEGYSDYFGVSEISAVAGSAKTKVGEYAFQNCTPFIRDLASLTKFSDVKTSDDAHVVGLMWASGLWKLQTEYGRSIVDKIAMGSLFLLSVKPGWIEAVEALVKADEAHFSGEHKARIRQVFYEDIQVAGGNSGVFRDPSQGIAEVGFRSCSAVPLSASRPGMSFWMFFVWMLILRLTGRKLIAGHLQKAKRGHD